MTRSTHTLSHEERIRLKWEISTRRRAQFSLSTTSKTAEEFVREMLSKGSASMSTLYTKGNDRHGFVRDEIRAAFKKLGVIEAREARGVLVKLPL